LLAVAAVVQVALAKPITKPQVVKVVA